MDYQSIGNKIASDYIHKNVDMNESIVKCAEEKSLNIEQVKRLVEESNKECFLQKFASSGEQIFDVASFEKVASLIKSSKFKKDSSMQKVASSEVVYNKFNVYDCDDDFIKNAGIVSGAVGLGINAGSKAVGFVAKAPLKRGLNPVMQTMQLKTNMKHYAPSGDEGKFISNDPNGVEMKKEAAELPFSKLVSNSFKEFVHTDLPKALPIMAFGAGIGLTAAAARKMGGLSARMMNQRQLNESFDTIIKNNNDLANIKNVRGYFDVIARHSPDLAKDPLVAPQLIRQFDAFDGVDLNTVAKMREMQYRLGPDMGNGNDDVYSSMGQGAMGLKSLSSFGDKSKR